MATHMPAAAVSLILQRSNQTAPMAQRLASSNGHASNSGTPKGALETTVFGCKHTLWHTQYNLYVGHSCSCNTHTHTHSPSRQPSRKPKPTHHNPTHLHVPALPLAPCLSDSPPRVPGLHPERALVGLNQRCRMALQCLARSHLRQQLVQDNTGRQRWGLLSLRC